MFRVIKNKLTVSTAYRLGEPHPALDDLIRRGRLVPLGGGAYEVFSQEAEAGGAGGQLAHDGDYIKIDSALCPYPNTREFFEANHRPIGGDLYEQLPKPLWAWAFPHPVGEEMLFLMRHKGLVIDPFNYSRYFTAPLYGTVESAARNAVIVFYQIERGEDGRITDAIFNFVERGEFNKTYSILD